MTENQVVKGELTLLCLRFLMYKALKEYQLLFYQSSSVVCKWFENLTSSGPLRRLDKMRNGTRRLTVHEFRHIPGLQGFAFRYNMLNSHLVSSSGPNPKLALTPAVTKLRVPSSIKSPSPPADMLQDSPTNRLQIFFFIYLKAIIALFEMRTQAILALSVALISGASARFSGKYNVWMDANDDDQCYFATLDLNDTKLNLTCGRAGCAAHGTAKIATAYFHCSASGGSQNFADIAIRQDDSLRYCREKFCTCMKTKFENIDAPDGGTKVVHFNFNDDHAWAC